MKECSSESFTAALEGQTCEMLIETLQLTKEQAEQYLRRAASEKKQHEIYF